MKQLDTTSPASGPPPPASGSKPLGSESKAWQDIRSMLADVRASLERSGEEDAAKDADILRRRAREYAMRNGNGHQIQDRYEDVLLFSLGDRRYAVSCSIIEEVIPMQNLVALPNAPRAVLGISNNRGVLFAVVDLKRVLNIPASELTTMHRVVMLRHRRYQIGLLVDAVHGMDSVMTSGLRQLPRELSEQTRRFLRGLSKDDILLLDAEEVIQEMTAAERETAFSK